MSDTLYMPVGNTVAETHIAPINDLKNRLLVQPVKLEDLDAQDWLEAQTLLNTGTVMLDNNGFLNTVLFS